MACEWLGCAPSLVKSEKETKLNNQRNLKGIEKRIQRHRASLGLWQSETFSQPCEWREKSFSFYFLRCRFSSLFISVSLLAHSQIESKQRDDPVWEYSQPTSNCDRLASQIIRSSLTVLIEEKVLFNDGNYTIDWLRKKMVWVLYLHRNRVNHRDDEHRQEGRTLSTARTVIGETSVAYKAGRTIEWTSIIGIHLHVSDALSN